MITDIKIVIPPKEPECVHWVAKHVYFDLKRLSSQACSGIPSRVVAGTGHSLVKKVLNEYPEVSHPEGFVIDKIGDGTLVVGSNHFRGTMFGLLEISRLLGIDPFEYFTDVPPRVRNMKLSFPIFSTVPAFRYRGFLINQEDLLAGWKKSEGPIPFEVFDQIFLTILRLGGNMVLPGTYLSADSPILDLASRRGLILAQLHFQILGTDVKRLTPAQKKKYSFVRFPEETINIWRQAIRANKDRESVWTLGYRGTDDEPFWFEEPGQFSAKRKGEIISQAIYTQFQLLKEELGKTEIPCVYYLYRENQNLYQKGYIHIPVHEDISIVWCDNGYGTMESYFRNNYELVMDKATVPSKGDFIQAWPEEKQPRGGIYYHVSFYDSAAPNRVQYVPPWKIQKALAKAHQMGLKDFLLLNVGNIREFVLGIATTFDFARAPKNWTSDPKYYRKFIKKWCIYYFGKDISKKTVNIYELLYNAHWWWSTSPGKCFGDNAVRRLMQDILYRLLSMERRSSVSIVHMPGLTNEECIKMIFREGRASLNRWEKVVALAERLEESIPGFGKFFFYENIVIQAKRGLYAVKTIVFAIQTVICLEKKDYSACKNALEMAKTSVDEWEKALSATDRKPKWERWSKGDRIVRLDIVRNYLLAITFLVNAQIGFINNDLHEHILRGTMSRKNG